MGSKDFSNINIYNSKQQRYTNKLCNKPLGSVSITSGLSRLYNAPNVPLLVAGDMPSRAKLSKGTESFKMVYGCTLEYYAKYCTIKYFIKLYIGYKCDELRAYKYVFINYCL